MFAKTDIDRIFETSCALHEVNLSLPNKLFIHPVMDFVYFIHKKPVEIYYAGVTIA